MKKSFIFSVFYLILFHPSLFSQKNDSAFVATFKESEKITRKILRQNFITENGENIYVFTKKSIRFEKIKYVVYVSKKTKNKTVHGFLATKIRCIKKV